MVSRDSVPISSFPNPEISNILIQNGASFSNKYRPNREEETLRLVLQYLYDRGFCESAKNLERESNIVMEPGTINILKTSVLNGKWGDVETLLIHKLDLSLPEYKQILFLVRRQKYLERIETCDLKAALHIMKYELSSLSTPDIIKKLSRLLIFTLSNENFFSKLKSMGLEYGRDALLSRIQSFLPSHIMLPPKRLERLLDQALKLQLANCLYHCRSDGTYTLLRDHVCNRNEFPRHCTQILKHHQDEVWCIQFSSNGKYLASASKDKQIIIWNCETWTQLYVLKGHEDSVSFLAWSPDGSLLATCGNDCRVILWDIKSGIQYKIFSKHMDIVTTCAFLPNGEQIISGSVDQSLLLWNTQGKIIHKWSGHRVTDLVIHPSGNCFHAVCQERKIRTFDLKTWQELSCITTLDSITSLTISKDGRYCLVSLANQEIHIWDIGKKRLQQKFQGHVQTKYVVRSCFGGSDQNFVISGSEDGQVYIWHRRTGILFLKLSGHQATVNAVAWRPSSEPMLASASDDGTVRIWSDEENSQEC